MKDDRSGDQLLFAPPWRPAQVLRLSATAMRGFTLGFAAQFAASFVGALFLRKRRFAWLLSNSG